MSLHERRVEHGGMRHDRRTSGFQYFQTLSAPISPPSQILVPVNGLAKTAWTGSPSKLERPINKDTRPSQGTTQGWLPSSRFGGPKTTAAYSGHGACRVPSDCAAGTSGHSAELSQGRPSSVDPHRSNAAFTGCELAVPTPKRNTRPDRKPTQSLSQPSPNEFLGPLS